MLNSFNSEILKLNEIGEPKISLTGKLNENEIWLEGAEVSKSAYPLLYLIYGDTYGTPEDENNFVLPDFRNRVIQGSDEFGYLEAGLPNLYGTHRSVYYSDNIGAIGVFSWKSSTTSAQNLNDLVTAGVIVFDASSYNSIYGNSSTVQPPSIKVRVKTRYE
ncbi:MAG: tail fiber protein [Candidatus Gastranaerophilales bacterium]|nr:tail fiber protein [Candidatus Gastranaerophilales bacterium]